MSGISTEDLSSLFPIRELSLRTGVNSVTLRAWERRYGLLVPKRTDKGHRLYSEQDVNKVKAILEWINKGVSVSKVRDLIEQKDLSPQDISNDWQTLQEQLLLSLNSYSENKIYDFFQQLSSQYPAEIYIRFCLQPVLKTLRAELKNEAQYLFLTACLINRINSRIVSQTQKNGSKVLLMSGNGEDRVWVWLQAIWCLDQNFQVVILDNLPQADSMFSMIEHIRPDYCLGHFDRGWGQRGEVFMQALRENTIPLFLSSAAMWLELKQDEEQLSQMSLFSDPILALEAFLKQVN